MIQKQKEAPGGLPGAFGSFSDFFRIYSVLIFVYKQQAALCAELLDLAFQQAFLAVEEGGKAGDAHMLRRAAVDHLFMQADLVCGQLALTFHTYSHITDR